MRDSQVEAVPLTDCLAPHVIFTPSELFPLKEQYFPTLSRSYKNAMEYHDTVFNI